jgi:hypothetical protein
MQSTSNTKAFIHKEQYGGKKKMKHPMKKKPMKKEMPKKKPMKKMGKPKKQGY